MDQEWGVATELGVARIQKRFPGRICSSCEHCTIAVVDVF